MGAEIDQARKRIAAAYDPELFRAMGCRLIGLLTDQVWKAEQSRGPVLPWHDPAESVQRARAALEQASAPGPDRDALADHFSRLVQEMLDRGHNLHDPRYIGHQVAASVPLAGLFDAVGSVTNQAMAIYDMGPWATAVEWAMVDRLGREIGWPPGEFAGVATHGGSLANLTALLTARNMALGDSWEKGTARPGPAPVLLVHADAHYSVARSAGILGLGTSNVLRVGLDERRRMDANRLESMLADLQTRGQPVVAVSACACSTPIGAFDPLEEIADVCRRYETWLHVDAAHGAAACLSARYRRLVAGLHGADSLVWDAHKMLFVPALCGFVFYRNRAHRFQAFRQDAPYLFDPAAPGMAEYDSALRTIECTKRAAVFGLWGLWSLFGPQLFADLVDVTFGMGRLFFEKLSAAPDFLPLHDPQCNIVAFRHVPEALREAPAEVLGRFQIELRRKVIESGRFYIVSTKLDGIGALRVTIINPLTTPDHLDQLLESLREAGRGLLR
ncbi:MAG: pyridoxal phosphate-dependent decarboxylase family protein [Thermoguttaceae bacterium]